MNEADANFYERTQWTWVKVKIVSILSAVYWLEKNLDLGGGVTRSSMEMYRTCACYKLTYKPYKSTLLAQRPIALVLMMINSCSYSTNDLVFI